MSSWKELQKRRERVVNDFRFTREEKDLFISRGGDVELSEKNRGLALLIHRWLRQYEIAVFKLYLGKNIDEVILLCGDLALSYYRAEDFVLAYKALNNKSLKKKALGRFYYFMNRRTKSWEIYNSPHEGIDFAKECEIIISETKAFYYADRYVMAKKWEYALDVLQLTKLRISGEKIEFIGKEKKLVEQIYKSAGRQFPKRFLEIERLRSQKRKASKQIEKIMEEMDLE